VMNLDLRQEPGTGPHHHRTPARQGRTDPVSQP